MEIGRDAGKSGAHGGAHRLARTLRVVQSSEVTQPLVAQRLNTDRKPVDPDVGERPSAFFVEGRRIALDRYLERGTRVRPVVRAGECLPNGCKRSAELARLP